MQFILCHSRWPLCRLGLQTQTGGKKRWMYVQGSGRSREGGESPGGQAYLGGGEELWSLWCGGHQGAGEHRGCKATTPSPPPPSSAPFASSLLCPGSPAPTLWPPLAVTAPRTPVA